MSIRVLFGVVVLAFLASCAETENGADGMAESRENSMVSGSDMAEESRRTTERRLQLERSVDQWWSAYTMQEFARADGLASHIETYVNENYPLIEKDIATASPRFRKVSAAALGFSGKQQAVPVLVSALRDSFSDVVFASLLSLWRLSLAGVDVPADDVAGFLSHTDDGIRSNASLVLAHATKPGQGNLFLPLTGAMEDTDPSVRVHAAAALGNLKDPGAIPFLAKALNDEKALVRIRSAFALGRIGDRSAIPVLIKSVDDPDVDVSKAAHKALKTITGQNLPRLRREWEVYWEDAPRSDG